jgi:uncharacterized protein YbaR (Trm112 family)
LKKCDSIADRAAVSAGIRRYNRSAMISQDLLDILVCPVCKKPMVLKENGESLKCGVCRRVYPIQDDIPILLIDAATIDAA